MQVFCVLFSGAYEFPAMRQLAISTGDAFILVYGVDDEASFERVELLRDQIIAEKNGDERTPIVIVGNKTDLGGDRRRVDQPTAETTASLDWGTGYVEVALAFLQYVILLMRITLLYSAVNFVSTSTKIDLDIVKLYLRRSCLSV